MNIRIAGVALFSLFLVGSSLIADCTTQPWTFANAYVTTTCGNVGIGTSSPANTLDVAGTSRFESDIFMGPINSANAKLWMWPGTSGPWMQGQSQANGTSIYFRGQAGAFTFSNSDMFLEGWQNPATLTLGTTYRNAVVDVPASFFLNINSSNAYPSQTGFKIGTSRNAWTGGSDLLTILQTGEVGIGTGSPASGVKLDINAASSTSLAVKTNGWGAAAGGWYTQTDGAAGINSDGAGLLNFRSGGIDGRLQISAAGNVGINTVPSTYRLDVLGGGIHTDALTVAGAAVTSSGCYTQTNGAAGINSDGNGLLNFRSGGIDGRIQIAASGNVSIGTVPTANLLEVNGNAHFSGTVTGNNIQAQYQDVAEWVAASEPMPAGTVVVVDDSARNGVVPSTHAYDTAVAGVISAQPGVLLGAAGPSKVKVATTGRVRVRVDASRRPVRAGDLLVSSDKPGVAMRSEPVDVGGVKIHRPGTLIGKALEPLDGGEGEILVLLSLQ